MENDNILTLDIDTGTGFIRQMLDTFKEYYTDKYPDYNITYEEILIIGLSDLHQKTIPITNTDWSKKLDNLLDLYNPSILAGIHSTIDGSAVDILNNER